MSSTLAHHPTIKLRLPEQVSVHKVIPRCCARESKILMTSFDTALYDMLLN